MDDNTKNRLIDSWTIESLVKMQVYHNICEQDNFLVIKMVPDDSRIVLLPQVNCTAMKMHTRRKIISQSISPRRNMQFDEHYYLEIIKEREKITIN